MKDLVHEYSNDYELGLKIRELYNNELKTKKTHVILTKDKVFKTEDDLTVGSLLQFINENNIPNDASIFMSFDSDEKDKILYIHMHF